MSSYEIDRHFGVTRATKGAVISSGVACVLPLLQLDVKIWRSLSTTDTLVAGWRARSKRTI